ncbi:MAG: hypothetical protein J5379_11125 [Clostridiales bacterium]|nr:hypothetical protein [Clostridiales bacterium]
MNGFQIFEVFFLSGLSGFGIVYGLLAFRLEKRNNLGDSHGQAGLYSSSVTITDRQDKMPIGVNLDKTPAYQYVEAHAPKKATYPKAPEGNEQVRKQQ